MRKGQRFAAIIVTLMLGCGIAAGAEAQEKGDPFKGKLFPPNVILENQAELGLSKEQFTKIRAAVVEVQANIAEHEWDLREAYLKIMAELDKTPIDEDSVLEHIDAALSAENQVKKQQVAMLVRLKNLLTSQQVDYLERIESK